MLPLFECAGVLDPMSRYAWVLTKPTSASGGRRQPRQVACAYRVGEGCFANLGYPEDIARTPDAARLTVRLTHEVLQAEGVAGLLRQLRAGLASRGDAPAALLVDVESIASTIASAELVQQKLGAFFSSTAPTLRTLGRAEPAAAKAEVSTRGGGAARRRLQELKVIRRWHRMAARNSSASQPAAEHSTSVRYLRLGSRSSRGGRGGGRGGAKGSRALSGRGGARGSGRGGARGRGQGRASLRGYAPGPLNSHLGRWGPVLRLHTCGDGMMMAPSRNPYVC